MAQVDPTKHLADLRLNTTSNMDEPNQDEAAADQLRPTMPSFRSSANSQDTIRATPPITIPSSAEEALVDSEPSEHSYIDHYMRNRQPSVSFNEHVKLDSGHRQSMNDPLQKPVKTRPRGRSMLQAISDDKSKSARAHSETDREQYDPATGRHLSKYSTTPLKEQPRYGEARFPLLQSTVDDLARESRTDVPQTMSMTSESTVSPTEEVRTPRDDYYPLSSPAPISPYTGSAAYSYEEPKEFKRTASSRWREGQSSPQDFFSRAGSMRKSTRDSNSRLGRRDTSGSARSPHSAASSFLRGFSMSSGTGADDHENKPVACDDEGQTIGEDYVLGKKIGWGGFSTIKEVTQLKDGKQRKLAVKIVRRNIKGTSDAENEQAQAEFEHEVELWRFLSHRHILPLEAVYKLDEATFCFIPLAEGGTLFDLVRSNRIGLPLTLAKSYTHQLASALSYLHLDARVVHRDIKLENCLLDRDPSNPDSPGLVRVCDFGMAEWLSNDHNSPNDNSYDRPPQKHMGPADTSTSAFTGGSLEYAAPEILRLAESGNTRNGTSAERSIVSPAVDIWAFGVCLYSLIVGSRPFQNSFQPRVVMSILGGDWDQNRLLEKGGPDVLELARGCLEMDDSARWTISDVLDCQWFAELAQANEDDEQQNNGGWRL